MHRSASSSLWCVVLALACAGGSGCDAAPQIAEGAERVDERVALRSTAAPPSQRALDESTRRALVTVAPRRRAEARAVLDALGVTIAAAVGRTAYIVSVPAGRGPELAARLQRVGARARPHEGARKLAPELTDRSISPGELVILVVDLFADVEPARVAAELRAAGYPVEGHGRGPRFGRVTLLGSAPAALEQARALAGRDDVAWVGRRFPRRLHNGTSVWVGQSGLDGGESKPVHSHGLRGEGQIAGLFDTGIDIDHCAFRDEDGPPAINFVGETSVAPARRKVIAVDFLWEQDDPQNPGDWDDNGHGTHVAGTIAGDTSTFGVHNNHDGMAPAAKLVVQDGGYAVDDCADTPALGCPVADLHFMFEQAYAQGVRVHQNSWGDNENAPIKSVYTDGSQDADEFMWAHPDILLVFSAGNDGPEGDTVLGPATGKNVLSVGATWRAGEAGVLAMFSSRGPTDDGRLKPDVTFPGVQIRSARTDGDVETDNCQNQALSGTSMSGPGAAGMAVLARQYYMDGFYPSGQAAAEDAFTPSGALLKATLINSARSMENLQEPAPSPEQGWGRVTLDDALHFVDDPGALFVDDDAGALASDADEPVRYLVEVHSGDAPLRATLAWTDYPSTPMAAEHLVNDLDLALTGPGGAFVGNAIVAGESIAGGEPDRIDNVEQIMLAAPTPGSYTLEVRAASISMGPQPFALVLRGDLSAAREPDEGGGTETESDAGTSDATSDPATDSATGSSSGGGETTSGATTSDSGAGSTGGSNATSAGPTGDDSTGAASGTDSEGGGPSVDGEGCGCRGAGTRGAWLLLLCIPLLGRARRRR